MNVPRRSRPGDGVESGMGIPRRLHPAERDTGETDSERRAEALIRLVAGGEEHLTTAEASLRTGFRPQAAAIAMETLRAIGWVESVWEPDLRMWRWAPLDPGGYSPPPRQARPEDRVYTISEAATASGLSRRAIQRRVERGTLASYIPPGERRRVVSHEALLLGGLVDRAIRTNATSRGISRIVQQLLADPSQVKTVAELQPHALLPRQVCELALIVLRAAALVERTYDSRFRQYTWRWADAD